MSSHSENHNSEKYDPITYIPHAENHGTKDIWMKFWILLGITILDIIMYYTFPIGMLRNVLFIIFGIVKAYYIVGTFMHLKLERSNLIMSIIIPVIFILYFIYLMLYEGNFWSTFH